MIFGSKLTRYLSTRGTASCEHFVHIVYSPIYSYLLIFLFQVYELLINFVTCQVGNFSIISRSYRKGAIGNVSVSDQYDVGVATFNCFFSSVSHCCSPFIHVNMKIKPSQGEIRSREFIISPHNLRCNSSAFSTCESFIGIITACLGFIQNGHFP